MSNPELPTLDPTALAQVSGGAITSTSSHSDEVLTALTGILSSIQSLAQPPSNGLNQQEMLLLLMILQQRDPPLAATHPWPAWGPPAFY